ncbi:MAG: hypothetical protein RR623_01120 [Bacilli bacterium]
MSLKNALMGFKKQLEDKATDEKIAKMLAEQSDILNKGVSKDTKAKPKKWFDESVLSNGGNTHYKLNDKWYRISVDSKSDVEYTQFKFHTTTALGNVLYISAKTYKDAQDVVDGIFGKKGLYLVSAT